MFIKLSLLFHFPILYIFLFVQFYKQPNQYHEKNCCKKCFDKYHKWHTKRDINSKEINDARIKIIIKDYKLFSMKQFYDMIKLSYESNQNNGAYKNNLVKVANCIKNEKGRNKYNPSKEYQFLNHAKDK